MTSILLMAIGVLMTIVGPGELALLCAILLLAPTMPASTVLHRIAAAVPVFMAAVAAVLTVVALLDLTVDWSVLAAGLVLVTGVLSLLGSKRCSPAQRWAGPDDLWATVAASLSLVMLARPFVGVSTGRRMALLSHGTDPGTHLQLTKAILEHGGYITFTDGLSQHLVDGVQHYPPALAGALALLVGVGPGTGASPEELLGLAPFAFAVLYALLVWFAVRVSLQLVRRSWDDETHRSALGAAVLLAPVLLVGFNVFLVQGGSYTQIVATTCCLAALGLATDAQNRGLGTSLVLGALAVLTCQTWYLLAPVVAVPVIAHVTSLTRRDVLRRAFIATVGLPVCLYPLFTGPDAHSQLNSPGAAPMPTILGVLGLIVALTVGLTYLTVRPGGRAQTVTVAAAMAVTALLLAVVIIGVQMSDGGTIEYYGMKMLYFLFLLGAVLATSSAVAIMKRGHRKAHPSLSAGVLGAALIGPMIAMVSTWPLVGQVVRGRPPLHQDGAVLSAVFTNHPLGSGSTGPDVWAADGCNRADDQIASKWAYDFGGGWTADRESTWLTFAYDSPDDLRALVDRAEKIAPAILEVYVHENCEPNALTPLMRLDNVRLIRVP